MLDMIANTVSELQNRNLDFITVFTKEVLDNQGASLYLKVQRVKKSEELNGA